jgi:hypothetical protein
MLPARIMPNLLQNYCPNKKTQQDRRCAPLGFEQ